MTCALRGCQSALVVGSPRPASRVPRATVTGTDLNGDPVTVTGAGELSRCLQHETGHLRGELFIDRLDRRERVQVMRRLRQLDRQR